jgi:glycosyltransferase involved in cell wall biosynthesis
MGSDYGVEQLSFALAMLPHLRRNRIDILHVQDPLVALAVQRASKLGLVDTKVILAHGTEEALSFQKQIVYLQHLAPFHLEEARQASVWKPTWTAIPNFIDTERFRPGDGHAIRAELSLPENAFVIITAAAIKKHHKRIDHLLKEFRTARDLVPGLPLYLVVSGGRESDTNELVSVGKELLGDSVRFLVQFPRERMDALYRAADVFVLCSLKEMMPIALLEASATGLPSLVNRHPVLEWMIGKGGRSIDMEATGTLAAEIVAYARDEDERKRLSSAARSHCVESFGTERVLAKIREYYGFVIEDRPVRGSGSKRRR